MSRLRVPTRAEVRKANAGTRADRIALGRKYGLSGAAAACVGLDPPDGKRKKKASKR